MSTFPGKNPNIQKFPMCQLHGKENGKKHFKLKMQKSLANSAIFVFVLKRTKKYKIPVQYNVCTGTRKSAKGFYDKCAKQRLKLTTAVSTMCIIVKK